MADTFVKIPKILVGTQAQVESEITTNDIGFATDIRFYNATETDTLLASKQPVGDYATNEALSSGLATKQPVGDYATNGALASGLALKVAIAQGAENAGKILKIDDSGNVIVADESGGASLPILYHTWSDHLLNDISWLRADTFSWHDGEMYKAAYNHLVSECEIVIEGVQYYAWGYKTIWVYTTTSQPSVGDTLYVYSSSTKTMSVSDAYITAVSDNDITINYGGLVKTCTRSIVAADEVEFISDIKISFYRAQDGHKICLPDQEDNISALYEATGKAWYYILDVQNTQFKLPRSKHNTYAETVPVVGNGMTLGLTNGTTDYGFVCGANDYYTGYTGAYGTSVGTGRSGSAMADNKGYGITPDPEKSGIIAQQTQDTDQYKYLYFYVGNFTQEATEQTAGLNAELFNGKADVDLSNINASQSAKETIVGWGMPDYSAGVDWVFTNANTAPTDGFVVVEGSAFHNEQLIITINGIEFRLQTSNNNAYSCRGATWIPVAKGDVVQGADAYKVSFIRFYPCKGVN